MTQTLLMIWKASYAPIHSVIRAKLSLFAKKRVFSCIFLQDSYLFATIFAKRLFFFHIYYILSNIISIFATD